MLQAVEIYFRAGDPEVNTSFQAQYPTIFPPNKWVNLYKCLLTGDLGPTGEIDMQISGLMHVASHGPGIVDTGQYAIEISSPPNTPLNLHYSGSNGLWLLLHFTISDSPEFSPPLQP